MNHSKLPWDISKSPEGKIYDADGCLVCYVLDEETRAYIDEDKDDPYVDKLTPTEEANAKYITHCCNIHHDLVAGLERLLSVVDIEAECFKMTTMEFEWICALLARCKELEVK